MITANATELKNNFGRYLDESLKGPVEVRKSGRRVAVLISAEDYDRLSRLEDAYWGERALAAMAEGFVGQDEVMKMLKRYENDEQSGQETRTE